MTPAVIALRYSVPVVPIGAAAAVMPVSPSVIGGRHIAGCPPSPIALLKGLLALIESQVK